MSYYFFPEDYEHLCRQSDDLRGRIRETFRDAAESTEQSSETFHDNFVFEDGQRQLALLSRQLRKLEDVINRAEMLERRPAGERVEIGSAVRVRNEANGEEAVYRIGSYMIPPNSSGGLVSYVSPLAQLLLGAKVGEVRSGRVGQTERQLKVLEIG